MINLETAQTETVQAETSAPAASSYVSKIPPEVMGEYRLLIRKRRLEPLTAEEEARLQSAMDKINEIDYNSPSAQAWRKKNEEIKAALDQIGEEAQAIIDARKP